MQTKRIRKEKKLKKLREIVQYFVQEISETTVVIPPSPKQSSTPLTQKTIRTNEKIIGSIQIKRAYASTEKTKEGKEKVCYFLINWVFFANSLIAFNGSNGSNLSEVRNTIKYKPHPHVF